MTSYLLTRDVLNVNVSCFANYNTSDNPRPVNLFSWLINTKYRDKVLAIRAEPDKHQRDAIKATLPAITPSGEFSYRQVSDLVQHSKLLQFDIDQKDNALISNYSDLKNQIAKLPFVAYCGLSVSGTGYWGLVPLAYPDRHGQQFDALKRVFAHYGIVLDNKPRSVVSLRGYSYDPEPYLPESVTLFDLIDEPPVSQPRTLEPTADADTERKRVEACVEEIVQQGTYLGDSYDDWYQTGCSLANAFGEAGRTYYHLVSQHYPGYQPADTDKQYSACLKANSAATLGTFFHLCKLIGIEYRELLDESIDEVTPVEPTPTRYGFNAQFEGELLEFEIPDECPADWNEESQLEPLTAVASPNRKLFSGPLAIPANILPLYRHFRIEEPLFCNPLQPTENDNLLCAIETSQSGQLLEVLT